MIVLSLCQIFPFLIPVLGGVFLPFFSSESVVIPLLFAHICWLSLQLCRRMVTLFLQLEKKRFVIWKHGSSSIDSFLFHSYHPILLGRHLFYATKVHGNGCFLPSENCNSVPIRNTNLLFKIILFHYFGWE